MDASIAAGDGVRAVLPLGLLEPAALAVAALERSIAVAAGGGADGGAELGGFDADGLHGRLGGLSAADPIARRPRDSREEPFAQSRRIETDLLYISDA